MNPICVEKYKCGKCDELHEYEEAAMECCAPEVEEVTRWKYEDCDAEYDDITEARLCCWDGVTVFLPTPAELEAAGQKRLAL